MKKTDLMIAAGMFLLFALFPLASLVFNPGQHFSSKDWALFIISPFLLSGMVIGNSSVQSARWLVKNDQDEVVSRRPMPPRVVAGLYAAGFAWGTVAFVQFLILGSLNPDSGGRLAAILFALLSLITGVFLFNSGPRRLAIDLQERRYSFTQGFPLLTWTTQGPTAGGELSINRVKSGPHQVRFRAPGWKYGLPLEIYMTEGDARALAWHLASELGLNVRREIN